MNEFNRIVQQAQAAPSITWVPGPKQQTFECRLECLGRSALGTATSKRRSKAAAVRRWLAHHTGTPAAPNAQGVSFEALAAHLGRHRPPTVFVADGDNSWDLVRAVLPHAQALYIVGSRSLPHTAPALPLPGAVCCLERCTGVGKDAADMMAAFRLGQLAERLAGYAPEFVVLSKDNAFDMLRRLLQRRGQRAMLVSHSADLLGRPPHSEGEEAQRRNQALVRRHGRIPSYGCWDGSSVGPPETWPQWWSDFTSGR